MPATMPSRDVSPKSPDDGRTSGSMLIGISNNSHSQGSQLMVWMSNSMVRLAFVGSVACTLPSVKAQMSHVSIVPNASLPASARSRAPSTLSRIHLILLAEKYASGISPVFAVIVCATSGSLHNASTMLAVRRHCHTMALKIGSPVSRFHTTVVSRWLVMPILSISLACTSLETSSSVMVPSCAERMSMGSCSTQPGCG